MKNKYGFPLVKCGRCGGSGHYSWNQRHGSTCYGCSGSGVVVAPKAKNAWNAFLAFRKACHEPKTSQLEVGDKVRLYGQTEFLTVTSVTATDERCGSSFSNGVETEVWVWMYVTLSDDSSHRVSCNQLWKRYTTMDDLKVDEFLGMIEP